MRIIIKSPEMLKSERVLLLEQAIELMRRQARSSARYSRLVNGVMNKLEEIDKQLRDT